ncbi:MAG: hypothetical protein HYS27_04260 [Deltaproteobacteria bacterium]|nr:hypothetical protein [Deltaproteobacteria bacterium]
MGMLDDDRLDALARSLPAAEPPVGFADAVIEARFHRRPHRMLLAGVVVQAGAIAATLLVYLVAPYASASHGSEPVVTQRRAVSLGDEVAAVLEPGAALEFDVRGRWGADDVRAMQRVGRAFYRVDKGTALVVTTPHGDVTVHGTCFSVDIVDHTTDPEDPMSTITHATGTARPMFSKTSAAAAAAGLLVGGLVVAVYEGEVSVKNGAGEVRVAPGEAAAVEAGGAPALVHGRPELARLEGENRALQDALVAARQALAGDPRRLADENAALAAKLKDAEQQLALVHAIAQDSDGVEVEPPADLPARFSEQALVAAFIGALKEAGIKGDVTHVDCGEYPCIVYGEVAAAADLDAMTIGERLEGTAAFAPYKDDANNASWWRSRTKDKETGEERDDTKFGIALYPKDDEEKRGEDIGKRVGSRNRQAFESLRPPR